MDSPRAELRCTPIGFGALDERNLPTEPDDVNGIVEASAAIETPRGPVVESLMEHGFAVHSVNPKQLDRFRDRLSPAGAKDDRRDARVLASALRTDAHCFRRLEPTDAAVVELREWSRLSDDLTRERVRLANRMRQQLWRYYPQFLDAVGNDVAAPWALELWRRLPTPCEAGRVRETTLAKFVEGASDSPDRRGDAARRAAGAVHPGVAGHRGGGCRARAARRGTPHAGQRAARPRVPDARRRGGPVGRACRTRRGGGPRS